MSDSEEEAFQSADEGETAAAAKNASGGTSNQSAASSQKKQKGRKQRRKKSKGQDSTESEDPPNKEPISKETKAANVKPEKSPNFAGEEKSPQPKTDTEAKAVVPEKTEPEETKSETNETPDECSEPADESQRKAELPPEDKEAEKASASVIAEQPSLQPSADVASPEKPSEQQQSILDKLSGSATKSGPNWGGWGSWGSSLLSTAASSVTTFTQQVGEGLNTVLETVESTLGAPDPEELANQERVARGAKEPDETPNGRSECSQEEAEDEAGEEQGATGGEKGATGEDKTGWANWGGWGISEVTKVVGETGKTLVTGGLDVLESIGKTTYNVIAEGDHGLKNIRQTGQKPNLSQILRDAKQEHEEKAKQMAEYDEARKANFGALFDEYNGLVHLEALESVSTQCDSKVQSLLGTFSHSDLNTLKKDLIAIKDKFEIDEDESDDDDEIEPDSDHTFGEQCKDIMVELGLPLTSDRLAQAFDRCRAWLKDCQEEQDHGVKMAPKEVHKMGIQSMAELTANSVQQFHKVAQLLQMTATGPLTIHVNRADCLSRLTRLLCIEVSYISVKFTSRLGTFIKDPEDDAQNAEINPLITNVYLEASNSKTYIQDAFRLLLPVVQHTALLAYSKEKAKEGGEDSS